MGHANNFKDKREIQHNTHNRKAGIAKFKRNLNHRKRRRWDNRIRRSWVEERELREPRRATRNNGNNRRQRAESEMPLT